jgi:hypothetical protein
MSTNKPISQTLPMQRRVHGIPCDFQLDEDGHGFIDVFIPDTTPPQRLLPEWIVRGALDLRSAIKTASAVIKLRLSGYIVWHDAEGLCHYLKVPPCEL